MKRTHFKFSNQWLGKKPTILREHAEEIHELIAKLAFIQPDLFSSWYRKGGSRKEALQSEIPNEVEEIESFLAKSLNKQFPNLGYSFAPWNGKPDRISASLSFRVGKFDSEIPNEVRISFVSAEPPFDIDEAQIEAIRNLIKGFHPDGEFKERVVDLESGPKP